MQEKIDKLYSAYLEERLNKILVVSKRKNTDIVEMNPKLYLGENSPILAKYEVDPFYNGFARIYDRNKNRYNIIDRYGNIMSKKWYDKISKKPSENIFLVNINYGNSFINTSGNLITNKTYFGISEFHDGLALVQGYNEKIGFIDTSGHEVIDVKYNDAKSFSEGYAVVEDDDGYTFIDKKGNPITDKHFNYAFSFYNGVALVENNEKYNFIKPNGELLTNMWSICHPGDYFDIGLCVVYYDRKKYVVGQDGSVLFTDIDKFSRDNGRISFTERMNVSTTKSHCYHYVANKNFLYINKDYVVCRNIDLNGYKANKTITGKYRLKKDNDVFDIVGKPVKIYGNNIILYLDKDNLLYLYDRNTGEKICVGCPAYTTYDDNAIYYTKYKSKDETEDIHKAYLIYNNSIFDISEYYNKKLGNGFNLEIYDVIDGYELINKNSFFFENEDEIKKELAEERERDRERDEEIKRQEELERLRELRTQAESVRITLHHRRKDALSQLEQAIKIINECNLELRKIEGDSFSEDRIKVVDLFDDVGKYKVIKPQYIDNEMLKKIDLSGETFENVKMTGIDFSNTNISFNPQKVYDMDLSGCNFEGVLITPFMDFTGVNIKGCRFSKSMNHAVSHQGSSFFPLAIYDETTTLDGEPFTEIYKDIDVSSEKNSKNYV